MAEVLLKGNPINTNGELPSLNSVAPDFLLIDIDLKERTLKDYTGKRKVLYVVPSIDTPICSLSARKFNESASQLKNTVVLVISADLPFAQKRYCATENIENALTLSMMRSKDFANAYGILITNGPLQGLCARAIIVLDENNKVIYTELVPEISSEPNYEKTLQALS